METKLCNMCNLEKPYDEFLWRNKTKGIKHYQCRECYKEIRKKSYESNKDYYLKKNIKKRNENVVFYREYKKDKKCVICGENEQVCLDFHHVNPNHKDVEVSKLQYSTYSQKKIINEIEKCIILCANCHRKVHANLIKVP